MQAAIFGKVGTLISFRVGESDAAVLAREFGDDLTLSHFTDLDNHEIRVRLLDGGVQRQPFLGKTIQPASTGHGRRHKILARSREKYSVPRAVVEAKIQRWMQPQSPPQRSQRSR